MENMKIVTEHVHRRLEEEAHMSDRIWQLPRLIPHQGRRTISPRTARANAGAPFR